jgi:signal transduction histidine kinase
MLDNDTVDRSIIRTGYDALVVETPHRLRRVLRLGAGLASRLTLVQRFAVVSLAILVAGAFIIGRFVADEIQDGVIARTSAITSLYVDSFVSPSLQGLGTGTVTTEERNELDSLLVETTLGEEIVSFKVWDRDGRIVYAKDSNLIGRQFEHGEDLEVALSGRVHASVSNLSKDENRLERQDWDRLLETYSPLREHETGAIIGAIEFYQDPKELESEIESSQRTGWLIVGFSTAGMHLLLVGLVKGASNTLATQHKRLGRLAQDNSRLAQHVRRAAADKTETDEGVLKRVAHDLHDGPAQDVSLALLRISSMRQAMEAQVEGDAAEIRRVGEDFQLVETALSDALKEVRELSADLHLPELEELTLSEVVERAKLDHESKSGTTVAMNRSPIPSVASLPLKIAVYRVLQEALNNCFRHAGAKDQRVNASRSEGWLALEIADGGPGFDTSMLLDASKVDVRERPGPALGLRGMRERVEMLGGSMEIISEPGRGTTVRVSLPLERGE